MLLQSQPRVSWPPLAWCARLRSGQSKVDVNHGRGVEWVDHGFCEAIWDGEFADGNFDQTDLVFGSGATVTGRGIEFVSSATTVDRLHWHQSKGVWHVSNSLACLLSQIGGSVDATKADWFELFESIIRGIKKYERQVPTNAGPVHVTYFENLHWDGDRLTVHPKPILRRPLDTFDHYQQFLNESLTKLGKNLADPRRCFPLRPLATVSTGYDSPASAAVARAAGLRETISISRGRGDVDDNGSRIADRLGLTPVVCDRDDALRYPEWVPLFIASDGKGEDLYFAGAAEHLAGRVLFTGYSGSRVWDISSGSYEHLRRGDQSGLSHTEPRLHIGYIHCPIPFFACTQQSDLRRLGRLPEMAPWSVSSDYNRPVCRRIVEEAGVPRDWFGQQKKAASVLLFDRRTFLPPVLHREFEQWLQQHQLTDVMRSTAPHKPKWQQRIDELMRASLRSLARLDSSGRWPVTARLTREGRLQKYAFHQPTFQFLFPWAMRYAVDRYR